MSQNQTQKRLNECLATAYQSVDFTEMKNLVSQGADIDYKQDASKSLLHTASFLGDLKGLSFLISQGANVNLQDQHKIAPLHLVFCGCECFETIKLLVKHGANVNLQDCNGWTSLFYACGWGRLDVVQFLVEAGADVTIKNQKGKTCIDVAKGEVKEYLQSLKTS